MIPVLTVATTRNKRLEILERSFQMYDGWDVRVLGVGRKWESFRTKMECYCEELCQIKPNQIVVCLDAYDAVCARGSSGLVAEFKKFKVPIVVGHETFAVPTIYNKYIRFGTAPSIDKWKAHHNISIDKYYVNSGCIVGYAGEVLRMWKWVLGYEEFTIYDDQIGVGFYMNEFPDKVKLDSESRIVWNDHVVYHTKVERRGNKLHVSGADHVPFFIHFPGMRETWGWRADRYRQVSAFVTDDDSLLEYKERDVDTDRWWVAPLVVVVVVVMAKMILGRRGKGGKKKPR